MIKIGLGVLTGVALGLSPTFVSAPDTRKGAAILLVVFVLDVVAVIAARVIKSRAQQKQGSQRPTLASLYRPGGKS